MTLDEIVTVYSEATPNPESMKFVSNRMILANDSVDFRSKDKVQDSPFATALFEFPYVKGVFIMNNFVSVTKSVDYEWFDIIPTLKKFVQEKLGHIDTNIDSYFLTPEMENSLIFDPAKKAINTACLKEAFDSLPIQSKKKINIGTINI